MNIWGLTYLIIVFANWLTELKSSKAQKEPFVCCQSQQTKKKKEAFVSVSNSFVYEWLPKEGEYTVII